MPWHEVQAAVAARLVGEVWPESPARIVEVVQVPLEAGDFVGLTVSFTHPSVSGTFAWGLSEEEIPSFSGSSLAEAVEGICTRARIDLMEHISERVHDRLYGQSSP